MSRQSRFEEISQRRTLRKTIFILVGIVLLVIVLYLYGIPLLINLSLFAERIRGSKDIEVAMNNSSYIAPPIIFPLKEATNSAKMTISGYALSKHTVMLYINGKYVDKIKVRDDKSFVFRNVILVEGTNDIKAKSVISEKESAYSQNIRIIYRNNAPNLEITSPQDNQDISSGDGVVRVEGKTDPAVRVTVNNYWAIVETDGSFSFLLRLQKGENIIKITATDEAGNTKEKETKVKLE